MNKTVSIQGAFGSYSYVTAVSQFGKKVPLLCRKQFKNVFNDVKAGRAGYALLPFRNIITGAIHDTFRLLFEYKSSVLREIDTPLDHTLLGFTKIPVGKLKYIYSHPQALSQCSQFLNTALPKGCAVREVHDTAGAKEYLIKDPDSSALIASGKMAKELGLVKIKYPVQNYSKNMTKFLLLSKKPEINPKTHGFLFIACYSQSLDSMARQLTEIKAGMKIIDGFQVVLKPGKTAVFFRVYLSGRSAGAALQQLWAIKEISYSSGVF